MWTGNILFWDKFSWMWTGNILFWDKFSCNHKNEMKRDSFSQILELKGKVIVVHGRVARQGNVDFDEGRMA